MKNFAFKIVFCLGLITLGCFAVSAAGHFDVSIVSHQVIEYSGGIGLAVAAVGAGFGNISSEMIQDAKLKYGKVKIITVEIEPDILDNKGNVITPGEIYHFMAKRPDRGLIQMLMPLAEQGKIDEFSDKAIKNLIIGGDVSALEDGVVYLGVAKQLKALVDPGQSFLSNA